jgi:mRNA interferase MazF
MVVIRVQRDFAIERGDIYLLEFDGSDEIPIKQSVLVIQNDIGNRFCQSVIVVPLFPNLQLKHLLLGVLVKAGGGNGLPTDHVALFTQIRTIDRSLFNRDNYLGQADRRVMRRADEAIKLSLGLSTVQSLQSKQQLRKKWRLLTNQGNRVC